MLTILMKILYIFLVLGVNIYICIYLSNKISARVELRRGYKLTRSGGIGFPVLRFFKYMSKDTSLGIWGFFLFMFSFLIWSTIPITANIMLVDTDYSFLIALFFYMVLLALNIFISGGTGDNFLFSKTIKKMGMMLSFTIPVLFCAASIVLISKTFSIKEIINAQFEYWNIVYQPLGFIVFFSAVLMQFKLFSLNRKNYFYGQSSHAKEGMGLEKAIIRLSEYMMIFFMIIVLIGFYMGGYKNIYFIRGEIILAVKFIFVFIMLLLLERTFGGIDDYRLLVRINWKFLVPLSLLNFCVTLGFIIYRDVLV